MTSESSLEINNGVMVTDKGIKIIIINFIMKDHIYLVVCM